MSVWDDVAKTRAAKIESVEGLVPGYGYPTEEASQKTDDTLSELLVQNLRDAKKVMFNILETAYEMHRELLLKDFEKFRDDIDVFSDEIKARVFKWDPSKTRKWLETLVDYDFRILTALGNLLSGIDDLEEEFLSSEGDMQDTKKLDAHLEKLTSSLDDMVILFKERDSVCNIKEAILEDSFEDIRKDIRESI